MSDSNHVDLSADFMMPTPWSSEDAGDTFETGDYICVFSVGAKTIAEDLVARGKLTGEQAKKTKNYLKDTRFYHHYTMMVYFKPGKDPTGIDSSLPEVIWTLESSNGSSPLFYTYSGSMHFMGKSYPRLTRDSALELFKARLAEKTELPITRIGDLDVGRRVKTDGNGKYWIRLKQELGIKEYPKHETKQERERKETLARIAATPKRTVIDVRDRCSMPTPWSGIDAGESYGCGDYILVFQKRPTTIGNTGYDLEGIQAAWFDHLKKFSQKDWFYSISVFYKPGRDPSGHDSFAPHFVAAIGDDNGYLSGNGFDCYGADIHWGYGGVVTVTRKWAFDELLARVRRNLHIVADAQLQKIGTIADAYRLKVGKEMPNPAPEMPDNEMITFVKKQDKRSGLWESQRFNGPAPSNVKFGGSEGSGCLGMLLLILSAPISLLCLTIFMMARS